MLKFLLIKIVSRRRLFRPSQILKVIAALTYFFLIALFPGLLYAQSKTDALIDKALKNTLLEHQEFVSMPNLPQEKELMLQNINWVAEKYSDLGFKTTLLESSTLPILLAEKVYNSNYKTVLFYFHIDGQAVNPASWDQEDPFKPELKEMGPSGKWKKISWEKLDGPIDDEWRIFARAAADDKAPILMLLTALKILDTKNSNPKFNVKVIFDPEEEYESKALLSTLEQYKERYSSDYFIVMDGPAHSSNKPTVTFGCRGIAVASITTFGPRTPLHSGHYGNYAPNPVFALANLLSSMKDEGGRVLVKDYYEGIEITPEISQVLGSVPFDSIAFKKSIGIQSSEAVGHDYQESLQYPSLNVRQIGTSWTGNGLKTVIPAYATANIDVRLVPETDGYLQMEKIRKHIEDQGYYVIDRDPTEKERMTYSKIVKFEPSRAINAFRTNPELDFGKKIRTSLSKDFGEAPVVIRIMGGTVPIVPLIDKLNVPTIIVPMVNMDNNQHSPNENIRVGNIREGIKICLSILDSKL